MLAWKKLAKRYSDRVRDFSANPALLLGMMVMQSDGDENKMAYRAAECLSWVFEWMLRHNPQAKNYVEIAMITGDGEQFFVTVQRPGGKTPSQLYTAAKAELEQLRKADGRRKCLKDGCDTWYRPGVLGDGGPRHCPAHNDLNP